MLLDVLKLSKSLVIIKKKCTDFCYDYLRENNPDYLVLNCPDSELDGKHIGNLLKDIIELSLEQQVIYITNKDVVLYWLRLFILEGRTTPNGVEVYVPASEDEYEHEDYWKLKLGEYGGLEVDGYYEDMTEELLRRIMKKQLEL